MASLKKEKETRTRSWTFVLYPESAPPDWRDRLDDFHIEWVESPLHDRDINGDGQPKKPHIHVLLSFGSVKSYDQVKEITDALNCPIPQRCHSLRAMVRYMAHIDNPEKAQYSKEMIIAHGGADLDEYLRPSASCELTYVKEMLDFVQEHNITEFFELVDYARENEFDTWFSFLSRHSCYMIINYIKSSRYRNSQGN